MFLTRKATSQALAVAAHRASISIRIRRGSQPHCSACTAQWKLTHMHMHMLWPHNCHRPHLARTALAEKATLASVMIPVVRARAPRPAETIVLVRARAALRLRLRRVAMLCMMSGTAAAAQRMLEANMVYLPAWLAGSGMTVRSLLLHKACWMTFMTLWPMRSSSSTGWGRMWQPATAVAVVEQALMALAMMAVAAVAAVAAGGCRWCQLRQPL